MTPARGPRTPSSLPSATRLVETPHRVARPQDRSECLSLLPGGAQLPDTMDVSKPLDQLALERGVGIRSIYQDSFRNDPPTVHYVRWYCGLGGEARTVPVVPMLGARSRFEAGVRATKEGWL